MGTEATGVGSEGTVSGALAEPRTWGAAAEADLQFGGQGRPPSMWLGRVSQARPGALQQKQILLVGPASATKAVLPHGALSGRSSQSPSQSHVQGTEVTSS